MTESFKMRYRTDKIPAKTFANWMMALLERGKIVGMKWYPERKWYNDADAMVIELIVEVRKS